MSVWSMPTVENEPTALLCRWRVYRFVVDDKHWDVLTGWDIGHACGRCSTPVIVLDAKQAIAQTRSGRVYVLEGPPGCDDDALYVFHARYGTQVPSPFRLEEVTDTYWHQIQSGAACGT